MPLYYVANQPFGYNDLAHHGILGQKWGVRRFQNADGSLTPAGRERYGYGQAKNVNQLYKQAKRKDNLYKARDAASLLAPYVLGGAGAVAGAMTANPNLSAIGYSGGTMLGGALTVANALNRKNTRESLLKKDNPVKNSEVYIPAGTEFKRTSLNEAEKEKQRLYVALSNAKYDMNYYSRIWPQFLKKISNNPNAKIYQNTYKVNGEIIAPSYNKRKEIADAIIQADKKMKTELGKSYALDQLRQSTQTLGSKTLKEVMSHYSKEDSRYLKEAYKKVVEKIMNDNEYSLMKDDNFKQFTASIPTSGKLMNAYIKELKKEGYNAVFDDNSNSFAPFIIFDSSMVTQTGSKELRIK